LGRRHPLLKDARNISHRQVISRTPAITTEIGSYRPAVALPTAFTTTRSTTSATTTAVQRNTDEEHRTQLLQPARSSCGTTPHWSALKIPF
jgi:hypothetical protein